VYPRPVDLVDILNDKKSNLKAMVESFNDAKEIKGVEVHQTQCSFTLLPQALNFSDHTKVGFTAGLEKDGYIYGVAIPESQSSGRPLS